MKTAHSPTSRAELRGEYGHKRPIGKARAARADRRAARVACEGFRFTLHNE